MKLKGVRLVRQDDIRYWATADDPDSARLYEAVLDECTEDGRCEACPRTWLRRRPRWPCSLWRDAHDILVTT